MNIVFTSLGSYPWQRQENLMHIGLVMKFHDPTVTISPAYFNVIDKHLLFLAAIKYGMTFQELTEIDMKRILQNYQEDREKRIRFSNGI